MVRDMQANIKRIVNLEALAAGTNKRRIMQQVRAYWFVASSAQSAPNPSRAWISV